MIRSRRGLERPAVGWLGRLLAIALASVGLLGPVRQEVLAQDVPDLHRIFVGGGFTFSDPVREFGRSVDDGWGFEGHARFPIDARGVVSLRVSGGFIEYGRESKRVCLSLTVGCRVTTDLVTTNNIFYMDFGPEVGFLLGPIRPWTGLGIGFGYFNTRSSLRDYDDFDYDNDVFETTNFDDGGFAWSSRTGVQIRLTSGRVPVFLDLQGVYHDNGQVDYLTKGDIEDNPDGSISIFPTRSNAELWTLVFGVTVGLPPDLGDDGRR